MPALDNAVFTAPPSQEAQLWRCRVFPETKAKVTTPKRQQVNYARWWPKLKTGRQYKHDLVIDLVGSISK